MRDFPKKLIGPLIPFKFDLSSFYIEFSWIFFLQGNPLYFFFWPSWNKKIRELPLNLIRVYFTSNSGNFFLTSLEKKIRELPLNLIYVDFISNSNENFLQENPVYFFFNFKLEIGFFSHFAKKVANVPKYFKFIYSEMYQNNFWARSDKYGTQDFYRGFPYKKIFHWNYL